MTSSAAAQYTKEGSKLKEKARLLIQSFIDEVTKKKAAGIKVKGNEPKMAYRAIRSMLLTPDSFYGDILEKALSEGWTGEKLKNKMRTMMEAGAHRTLSPAPHFTGHHTGGSLASLGPSASVAKPEVLRQALIEVTERGAKLGESGLTWLPEYAHTGAINQRLKKLGLSEFDTPGSKFFNAHLGDNKFKGYAVDPVHGFGNVDNLVKSWWDSGVIPQQMLDAQVGIEAASSELNELSKIAKKFNLDIDKNPAEVQKLLKKNPDLLQRVVSAGKTPIIENVPSFEARASLGNLPEAVTKNHLLKDYVRNITKTKAFKVGAATTFGVVGFGFDALGTYAGTDQAIKEKDPLRKVAGGFEALSGVSGIASLTPAAPVAVPVSLLSGGVSIALNYAADLKDKGPLTEEERLKKLKQLQLSAL